MGVKEQYELLCKRISMNQEKSQALLQEKSIERDEVDKVMKKLHSRFHPKMCFPETGCNNDEAQYLRLIEKLNQWMDARGWQTVPAPNTENDLPQRRTEPTYPLNEIKEE